MCRLYGGSGAWHDAPVRRAIPIVITLALGAACGAHIQDGRALPARPPAPGGRAYGSFTLTLNPTAGIARAASFRSRIHSVAEVQAAFKADTGLALVRFTAASTADVTSLRTRPHATRRFGDFQLFVFRPGAIERMRHVFTHGIEPDGRHIYWVPDQAGGEIAVTLHARNLCVGWFPPGGAHAVDARWERLQAAVKRLA
jgi:hypothetical protein